MVKARFIILCMILLGTSLSMAASNTAVLPRGVWHPSVRYGIMSELTNKYDNSGSLQSIGRLNQAFDGESLARQVPEFSKLATLLSGTYPNSNYAEQLSAGALEFDANADIKYTALVLAYGISPRITLAAGVPIVTINAQVSAYQTGINNARAIRNQISADGIQSISPDLDNGLTRLENADLVLEYEKALESKGYVVPRSANSTVTGDLMLAVIYQYWENRRWTFSEQTTINLPTGPEDNPDDFLDIPVFHQTYIKFDFKQDFRVTNNWSLGLLLGYTWKIPDTAVKRVPKDENDILPDADRKERVNRDLGDVITIGGSTGYWITNYLNFGTGYDYSYKSADTYSGARGYNYSLLSRNTESNWHRVYGVATFSTVQMFMAKEFAAPLIVSYMYSDIIAGTNVDRQLTHEFTLKMFF